MTKYQWTTQSGIAVEMEVSQSHVDKQSADGYEVEVTMRAVRIENLVFGGKSYGATLGEVQGHKVALFAIDGKRAAVVIPTDIYNAMMAETRARVDRMLAVDEEYEASRKLLERTMNP